MSIAVLNTDSTRSPISEDRLAALVDVQRAALRDHGVPGRANRLALLRLLNVNIARNTAEILEAIQSDFDSRSIVETWLYDLRPVQRTLRQMCRRLCAATGVSHTLGETAASWIDDGHGIGISGFVPTWHFPVAQALVPVVEAIAVGHRVVLALPHQTPQTSDAIKRIIGDVFPADHVVAVMGGENVASAFARLPLDKLHASTPWPQARSASLAAGSGLVPLSLAVQGRGAAVVARGYSLDLAAQQIMRSKLFNAGQHPSAPDIVYVPRGAVDIFLGYARHAVAAMYPNLVQNPDYGSMVSTQHADLVRYMVEDAIDRGGQIIRVNPGGESFTDQIRKIAPTLLVEVGDEMAALRQPILGPVLAVRAYHSLEEVVEHSTRGTDVGSVCWFDLDPGRAHAMIPRLSPRRAWFNGAPPFGSVLSTILPPLLSGDFEARGSYRSGVSGKPQYPVQRSLMDRASNVKPPYGASLRAFAAWKLGDKGTRHKS